MKDLTIKVVILEILASPYVHQAIIVMRDYNPKLEAKAVIEAERIVDAYLSDMKLKSGENRKRPIRRKRSYLAYLAVSAISVLCSVFIMKLF